MEQEQANTEAQPAAEPKAAAGGTEEAQKKAEEALSGLEGFLAPIFEKFPHLPAGGREFIVTVAPWVALIFGILGVISLLGLGGIGILLSIVTFGLALPMLVHVLLSLVSAVLLLMSFTGLKARTKRGWNLAFYSLVASTAASIWGIFFGEMMNITGLVISALIGFYLTFEIRSYYK